MDLDVRRSKGKDFWRDSKSPMLSQMTEHWTIGGEEIFTVIVWRCMRGNFEENGKELKEEVKQGFRFHVTLTKEVYQPDDV